MYTSKDTWWIFALLSAFFAALTTILAKIGVKDISSNAATAIRTVVVLVIAWGIVFFKDGGISIGTIPRKTLVFLVLSGVATGLSWLCYFRALQIGKASFVGPVDKSSIVMIVLLSALFLGEALTWKSIVGSILIVAGTLVFIM